LGCPVNFVGPVFVIGLLQKQKPNLKHTKSTTPRSLSIIRKQDKNYKNAPDDYEKQEITQRNATTPRFVSFLPPPAKLQEEQWIKGSDRGEEFLKKLEQWIKGIRLTMVNLSRSVFLAKL
jgi:hypothetical protein